MKLTIAQKIEKTIGINAPKEKVWKVLTEDALTRKWYEAFSPGTHAITDWQLGSKAIFTDHSNNGLIARITANQPARELAMEYTGLYANGQEDYESPVAKDVTGGREIYTLAEANGVTTLTITCDMGPEWFEQMAAAWDVALQKIKQLAEGL